MSHTGLEMPLAGNAACCSACMHPCMLAMQSMHSAPVGLLRLHHAVQELHATPRVLAALHLPPEAGGAPTRAGAQQRRLDTLACPTQASAGRLPGALLRACRCLLLIAEEVEPPSAHWAESRC